MNSVKHLWIRKYRPCLLNTFSFSLCTVSEQRMHFVGFARL